MDLAHLIGTHGYWVLFLGCLLEGETLVVLAGVAVHRGYLNGAAVVAVAGVAAFAGDQATYWLGRRHGTALLARFPALARRAPRVHRMIARHPDLAIVGVRFAYGLRTVGPMLIGSSGVSALRFAALNALGAAVWAVAMTGIGWAFGEAARAVLGDLRHVEGWLFLGVAALGLLMWAAHRILARHR